MLCDDCPASHDSSYICSRSDEALGQMLKNVGENIGYTPVYICFFLL